MDLQTQAPAGIDALIERRAWESKAKEERGELWRESVRKYHERNRRAFTWEWYRHYAHLARLHGELAEENGVKAAGVLALLGEPGGGG